MVLILAGLLVGLLIQARSHWPDSAARLPPPPPIDEGKVQSATLVVRAKQVHGGGGSKYIHVPLEVREVLINHTGKRIPTSIWVSVLSVRPKPGMVESTYYLVERDWGGPDPSPEAYFVFVGGDARSGTSHPVNALER